jgi:hypothetical protein
MNDEKKALEISFIPGTNCSNLKKDLLNEESTIIVDVDDKNCLAQLH